MTTSTPIDLSRLPAPTFLEVIDFETLYAQRKAALIALYPEDQRAAVAATLELESEPSVIHLQENCYREMVLRQRVNDAGRALLLAYANDGDLDQLAAFFDIQRLTITPADPENDVLEVKESNDDLRYRTQLAPQGFSVAGPEGAYRKHALDASGLVLDASAYSPAPCEVVVTVLSRIGDGSADQALLDVVAARLTSYEVRPLTDLVTVRSADIVNWSARATLVFFAGPDRSLVLAEAQKRTKAYADEMHKLGMEITIDGVHAAMRAAGVQKVVLTSPAADIPISKLQAAFCTSIELIDGGVYE